MVKAVLKMTTRVARLHYTYLHLPKEEQIMHGKICMVTGATSGLGQVTARALAERGATVIVVGRSPQKCAATVSRIKQQTGNASAEFMPADLSSQQDIHQLAQYFKTRYPRLDVLVNNAGAFFTKRRESVDGIEMTLALNHLGYFLLTNLLLDTLQVSAPSRIVNVSSGSHFGACMNFDDLQAEQRYDGYQAYSQSKLANLLFTYELARRLGETGIAVNAVNPGFAATNIGLNNFSLTRGRFGNAVRRLMGLVANSAEEGAQTTIYMATAAEVEGVTGKYFEKQTAVPSSKESYDTVAANRLWQVSAELTGLTR
jgi:retinol dehydrogenase 12